MLPLHAIASDAGVFDDEAVELAEDKDDAQGDAEGEAEGLGVAEAATDGGWQFTAALTDAQLEKTFVDDPKALGSVSFGLAEAGRVMNGVQLQSSDAVKVVSPDAAWGTQEVIDSLNAVAELVHQQVPKAAPLRVNHIGKQNGGYLRPHHSHQSGRDVDLGFYFEEGVDPQHLPKRREDCMDLAANWWLVRALAMRADVQVVLLDRRVQKKLADYAIAQGEDPKWVDSLFHAGRDSMFQHARRHRDHFHVRFFSPKAQELGRRLQPLLARRAEENVAIHRIRRGDTLLGIAVKFGSTVSMIERANALKKGQLLRLGRTLNVPLRGPCTKCPQPPPVVLPARRVPPDCVGLGKVLCDEKKAEPEVAAVEKPLPPVAERATDDVPPPVAAPAPAKAALEPALAPSNSGGASAVPARLGR